jgi:tetratricopeptide (TPR) repeat protein
MYSDNDLKSWPKLDSNLGEINDEQQLSLYEIQISGSNSLHLKAKTLFLVCQLHLKLACQEFGQQNGVSFQHYMKGFKSYINMGKILQSSEQLQKNVELMRQLAIAGNWISDVSNLFPPMDELNANTNSINEEQISAKVAAKSGQKEKRVEEIQVEKDKPVALSPKMTLILNLKKRINKLLLEEKNEESLKLCKQIINEAPNAWATRISCLHLYSKLDRYSDVERQEAQFIIDSLSSSLASPTINSYRSQAYYYIGLTYAQANNLEQAIYNYEKAEEIVTNWDKLNIELGRAKHKQMQIIIKQLHNIDESSSEVIELRRKRDECAERTANLFDKVAKDGHIHYTLGEIADLYGNYEDAILHYIKAVELTPKYSTLVQVKLGNLYIEQQDYTKAIRQFRICINNLKTDAEKTLRAELNFRWGVACERNNDIVEAYNCYSKAVKLDRTNCVAIIALEKLAFQNKSKLPDFIKILKDLGIQHSKEQYQYFLKALEHMTKLHNCDRLLKSVAYCLMGYVHSNQLKDLDAAIECYQQAADESPLSPSDLNRQAALTRLKILKDNQNRLYINQEKGTSKEEDPAHKSSLTAVIRI